MQNDLIDLIKQKVLDADPRAIKQINFAAKLDGSGKSRIKKKLFCTFHKELEKFCECNSLSDLIFIV